MEALRNLQQAILDHAGYAIIATDPEGTITVFNRAAEWMLGYSANEVIGTLTPAAFHDAHEVGKRADAFGAELGEPLEPGFEVFVAKARRNLPNEHEWLYVHKDGTRFPVLLSVTAIRDKTGTITGYLGLAVDITERRRAQAKEHAAMERLRLAASVFDHAHAGIMVTDTQQCILEVNSTFTDVTGYTREEAIGQTPRLLKSGYQDATFYQEMWRTLREKSFWRGEIWNRRKSGEVYAELLTLSAVHDALGNVTHYVGIFSDITLQKEHQRRLELLAHFDPLTDLPNRVLLADRLRLAIARTQRAEEILAICYLDLDGFKPVNDAHGHDTGDRLLIEVASRLLANVRGGDTVARLGGDEFVLLLSLADTSECDAALNRILQAVNQPYTLNGKYQVNLSASVGVTLYPLDGADADTLLRHADQAMYDAKKSGRNRYHVFDHEDDRRDQAHREAQARLERAFADDEFIVHYQPKVDMRLGKVVGAEALARWQHPERGLLLPGEFLPLVENSSLATRLGEWVLGKALMQMRIWRRSGIDLSISVNIAARHLQQKNFAEQLAETLANYPEVPPDRLELEVTETAALEDVVHASNVMQECRKRFGIRFAIDDFGTGYSSLAYLRRLPADVLKIDQSFVRDLLNDEEDCAIVEGVIGLAQAFHRQVVAEGVEDGAHGVKLLEMGCRLAQGFGIGRPMPAEAFPAWIAAFEPDPRWATVQPRALFRSYPPRAGSA